MVLEVYIDIIFIINLIMDLILLYIVKMILKLEVKKVRFLVSAAIGALGACVLSVVPNLNIVLQLFFCYILIPTLLIRIAYPIKKKIMFIKACILLYVATFFLGGLMNSLYYHTKVGYYFSLIFQKEFSSGENTILLVFSCVIILAAVLIFIKLLNNLRGGEQLIYNTDIYKNEKHISVRGLLDTGNNLYDPISRKPVVVMDILDMKDFLTKEENAYLFFLLKGMNEQGMDALSSFEQGKCNDLIESLKVRMIPYHSIGKSGLLPAITVDKFIVWKDQEQIVNTNVLIGISEARISKQNDYRIILHRGVM